MVPVRPPTPIVALDVPSAEAALDLIERVPRADFFKVGLQLYSAAGPQVVRTLKDRGLRVFLDLKLHDIPNTVGEAVRAVSRLRVDLLTVHAAGGPKMLRAAVDAAAAAEVSPRIFAVTVLTSLGSADLATVLGRSPVEPGAEAVRLAGIAQAADVDGVVASVYEVGVIRAATRPDFSVLTPGIRLPGDDAGDQVRVATPVDAARAEADYIVVGRSVTAAPDPALAYDRVLDDLAGGPLEVE